jgi:NAD-dependent SIR2 family protein deacetylase
MVERVVYVLGAGSSSDAGGPLTRDFFSRLGKKDNTIYARHFDNNSRYLTIEAIYRDWSKNKTEHNVEEFFKDVSLAWTTGERFADPTTGRYLDHSTLERYLTWYIASYVHWSVAARGTAPGHYRRFARSLRQRGKRFSVITFNYDLVFERAILRELGSVNYCLPHAKGPREFLSMRGTPFLKLHGSLNWLRCPKCGRFEVSESSVAHVFPKKRCLSRCGELKEPVIVPPVSDKSRYLGPKNILWKKASDLLSDANTVVIIGYSLPMLDIAAQGLLRSSGRSADGFEFVIVNRTPQSVSNVAERLGLEPLGSQYGMSYTPHLATFKDYVEKSL